MLHTYLPETRPVPLIAARVRMLHFCPARRLQEELEGEIGGCRAAIHLRYRTDRHRHGAGACRCAHHVEHGDKAEGLTTTSEPMPNGALTLVRLERKRPQEAHPEAVAVVSLPSASRAN